MEVVLRPQGIVVAYWLVMVFLSAFFLRMACGICRVDLPSWKRAIVSVVVITALAYLSFDYLCYLIMRSMDGVMLVVPPGYGYNFWFREPIGLKLYIISHVGMVRYIPFVVALCVAGFLQVLALDAQVGFRWGLFIYLLQAFATVVAGYIVSLFFGLAIYPPANAPGAGGTPPQGQPPAATQQQSPGTQPKGEPDSLQVIHEQVKQGVAASREYVDKATKNLKEYGDSQMDELDKELEPFTKHLPAPARKFLKEGGWWAVLGVLAFIALLWIRSLLRRMRSSMRRSKKRRKRTKRVEVDLSEDLSTIGEAYTEEGPERVLVKGLPARLRLVILSLGNRNPGGLSEEMADRVLDWIKPGLAHATAGDFPRVRVWPPFYSASGFAGNVVKNVAIPESKGSRSHWVVVSGQAKIGLSLINVCLAFHTDEPNTLRHLAVSGDRWLDVIAVKSEKKAMAAR